MLEKITKVYANHGMPIECDVYTAAPPAGPDVPVALFFHAGGLTGWGRDCVPPWLVQACYKQRWPLISASYRLMPQTGTEGLAEDVTAAYDFAQNWDCGDGEEEEEDEEGKKKKKKRRVIVVGASAGFFLAAFLGRTADPPPLALLSIAGINTFTHPFYRSSVLLTPSPTPVAAVAAAVSPSAPPMVGRSVPNGHEGAAGFRVSALREDGLRRASWPGPPTVADARTAGERAVDEARGLLYRYLVHGNAWPGMTAALDGGREWEEGWGPGRRAAWPRTVVVHGDADAAVPLGVSERLREVMGAERVVVVVAEGRDHLFERALFLEDEEPGMEAVREVVAKLVEVVKEELA